MKRLIAPLAALALLAPSCLGGSNERILLVDFSHEQFASFFLFNFPEQVTVRQGTKLVFRQTWTGEPHTVTGGTLVDEWVSEGRLWFPFFDAYDELLASGADIPDPDNPGDATIADFAEGVSEAEDREAREAFVEAYEALREDGVPFPDLDDPSDEPFRSLIELVDEGAGAVFGGGPPWAMDFNEEDGASLTQNAGQPCYLRDGLPPEDPEEPCDDADQQQPPFDGTHSYYNSGIIPFEGAQGNTFEVQLSDDIEPGSYMFYCAVHGPGQRTELEVVPADADAPTQDEVARATRREIDRRSEPLRRAFAQATDEGFIESAGERIEGPFAGIFAPGTTRAAVNEFIPRRMTVGAGEPITWKMMGAPHTITFDVPEYFPIMEFADDGTVRLNPMIEPPAGGAPEVGEVEPMASIDGGTYHGQGFWSSGLLGTDPYVEYTVRISRPGTYRYACLLHPPMVGTIEVT